MGLPLIINHFASISILIVQTTCYLTTSADTGLSKPIGFRNTFGRNSGEGTRCCIALGRFWFYSNRKDSHIDLGSEEASLTEALRSL